MISPSLIHSTTYAGSRYLHQHDIPICMRTLLLSMWVSSLRQLLFYSHNCCSFWLHFSGGQTYWHDFQQKLTGCIFNCQETSLPGNQTVETWTHCNYVVTIQQMQDLAVYSFITLHGVCVMVSTLMYEIGVTLWKCWTKLELYKVISESLFHTAYYFILINIFIFPFYILLQNREQVYHFNVSLML
jgi:hypothetical protein